MHKVEPTSDSAFVAALKTKAYVPLPMGIDTWEIRHAVNAFQAFLRIPMEVRRLVTYRDSEYHRGGRIGYKTSDGALDDPDRKDYFHYHPRAHELFAGDAGQHPPLAEFLDAAKPVYLAGIRTVQRAVHILDRETPGLYDGFFPQNGDVRARLRFLNYYTSTTGAFLARGHYDIGTLTLAMAESAPGLRIGGDEGTPMERIERTPGEGVLLTGGGFPKLTGNAYMPAWHDVEERQAPGSDPRASVVRWAIVLFLDHPDNPPSTWEEMHTRQRGRTAEPSPEEASRITA